MARRSMYNWLLPTSMPVLVFIFLVILALGCVSALPAVDMERATAGRQVYEQYNCLQCHGYDGNDKMDLKKALHKKGLEDLKAWILDPGKFKPGTEMPAYGGVLSDRELEDVIQYLRQLAGQ